MPMRPRCRTTWRAPSISPRAPTPDEVVFAKNELSEMLPRPTPLSLSLMESLWAAGGSVDLAARELGLHLPGRAMARNYLVTILGRLYVDKREEQSRALVISAMASRRLLRDAARIESDFRERLPAAASSTRSGLLNVVDFEKLSTAELIAEIKRLHDRFVFDTHVAVDVVNIAAGLLPRPRAPGAVRRRDRSVEPARPHPGNPRGAAIAEINAARRPRAAAGCC